MTTTTAKKRRSYTVEDFLSLPRHGQGYELVDGRLEPNRMGAYSCRIGNLIATALQSYCARVPGWVFGQDSGYRCFPDAPQRIRKPDASFIAFDRYSFEQCQSEPFITVVPDLVAEVISPRDIALKVERKIGQWLAVGVKVVWVVYPNERIVREHRLDGTVRQYRERDELAESGILPGFSLPIAELFQPPKPN